MTTDTTLPAYMAYPKFLLEMIDLSETAKLVYIVLLDRARVSQAKGSWADEHGNVFIFYPIRDLAESVHKSEMSVKTALSALEKCGLILRTRLPRDRQKTVLLTERKLSVTWKENCPEIKIKRVKQINQKEGVKPMANSKMFFSLMVTSLFYNGRCHRI